MKLWGAVVIEVAVLTAHGSALAADEGRFDAQVFRPLAAPRDLVMVPKSEVIGHLSPVVGVYWDAALDPLALVVFGTNKHLDVVGARLQITPLLGFGFFDWAELTMAVPFVAWQTSDNLRSIGTEGEVRSSPSIGDIRISSKVALPFVNRKAEVKSGFGMAISGNINLPTGDPLAFTSDGALSGGVSLIADYRFNFGLLLASNLGVWLRPEHQFASVKVGDMAQFGVAAEMYIVQRWGLSVLGEVYGYPSLTGFPDSADQVPAEVLLGLRWQTRQGITLTVGGSFGAACGFGAPAIRVFNSLTWQPKKSVEQREINKLLERDSADPDHDGLIEGADKCPDKAGPRQNQGCPDQDRDKDGVIDREDQCPDLAVGTFGIKGCPPARVDGDIIATIEPITFELDSAELSDRTKGILEGVRRVMIDTGTIHEVEVGVFTSVRESEEGGVDIAHKRAVRIMRWLINSGIERERLSGMGYGYWQPEVDDTDCLAAELSPECKAATQANERVVFRIKRWGAPASWAILGGDGPASVLPTRRLGEAAQKPLLPTCRPSTKGTQAPIPCVLPMKPAVLNQGSVLKKAKDAEGRLPTGAAHRLPAGNVLPKEDGKLPERPQGAESEPETHDGE